MAGAALIADLCSAVLPDVVRPHLQMIGWECSDKRVSVVPNLRFFGQGWEECECYSASVIQRSRRISEEGGTYIYENDR